MNKLIIYLLLYGLTANASIDNFTKKIFDLTNPSGADKFSPIQDVSTKGGYSINCINTGNLTYVATIMASNQNDVPSTSQTFTDVSGSTQTVTNTSFIWDVVLSNANSIKLKIGTFTGTGTAKCYFTAKDI